MPDRYRPPPPRRPWLGGFAGRVGDSKRFPRIVLILVLVYAVVEAALIIGKHVLGIHGLPDYTGMPPAVHKQVEAPRTLEEAVDELVARHPLHDTLDPEPATSHPPIDAASLESLGLAREASSVALSLVAG